MLSIVRDFLDGICSGELVKIAVSTSEKKIAQKIEQLNKSIEKMQICINRHAFLSDNEPLGLPCAERILLHIGGL